MITLSKAAEKGDDSFEKLGITQEELQSLNQEELFARTIEGLQNMESGTERTALASKLLGGSAKELGALLNTSAEDTEKMRQTVHDLGGVMSDDAVKAAAAYQDSLQDMNTAIDGAKRGIVSNFLPSITSVMDGITGLFSGDSSAIGKIEDGIDSFIKNLTGMIPKVIEKGKLVGSFFNSLLYAGTSTVLTVILASMAAYIFSRRRSKKMGILYMYIVLGMVIPVNYVTLTKIMQLTHLVNTAPGIILLYTAMQIPFSVFLIFGFVSKIPSELDEAAILDGSTPFQLFIRVILPMLKPAVITAGVLCFLNTWNEFIMPLYFLHSSGKWPMTLAIYNFFGQYEMSWNLICADVILTCLPVVLLYVTCQKYIVGGQTEGAVKG